MGDILIALEACFARDFDGTLRGSFDYVKTADGSQYGVANGDVIKASMMGNVITVYMNGVQVLRATDNTFARGSPGMGFYIEATSDVNRDYGFTSFAATDE